MSSLIYQKRLMKCGMTVQRLTNSKWIRTSLHMEQYQYWSTSVLYSWFFTVFYINDLTEDLTTNAKLFADNTPLFSVVHDT